MRLTGALLGLAIVTFTATVSSAEVDRDTQERIRGLAQVIAYAQPCGYQIDQSALERYAATNRLNDPEALAMIHTQIIIKGSTPSPAECTLSRSTGQATGLLQK
ncbi:hypothetical protein [Rhizobium mayense]|uniref:Uncharacterized protein n=1 Tax=Rhizobium mayense TaxID=1312184 RepID=A0ABT7K263_9HYPH|nr:hypothetical protein [Rhizobium mayense]MDL2401239.1 hypothetical protein [Rhizobium mayense]